MCLALSWKCNQSICSWIAKPKGSAIRFAQIWLSTPNVSTTTGIYYPKYGPKHTSIGRGLNPELWTLLKSWKIAQIPAPFHAHLTVPGTLYGLKVVIPVMEICTCTIYLLFIWPIIRFRASMYFLRALEHWNSKFAAIVWETDGIWTFSHGSFAHHRFIFRICVWVHSRKCYVQGYAFKSEWVIGFWLTLVVY